MVVDIEDSKFTHNNGTVVNDIYFDFTVIDMTIYQTEFLLDITQPSRTKKAQAIYKDLPLSVKIGTTSSESVNKLTV